MRVRVTVTSMKMPNKNRRTIASADMFIEGDNLLFESGDSSNLKVTQFLGNDASAEYQTDFAFSGVNAVLAAAATTGGHFVLT